MRSSIKKGPQDEHVQGALENGRALFLFFHGRRSTFNER
jgi:hypothetical protein